eukprot:51175-Rhodomonas_salina.1
MPVGPPSGSETPTTQFWPGSFPHNTAKGQAGNSEAGLHARHHHHHGVMMQSRRLRVGDASTRG